MINISHHTRLVLERAALASTCVVFPALDDEKRDYLAQQITPQIKSKHRLVWGQGGAGLKLARDLGLPLSSMGRSLEEDPAFFQAASACGEWAAQELRAFKPPSSEQ